MFDDSIRVTVVGTSPLEEGYSYVQRGGLSAVLQMTVLLASAQS